jgi:hypothetical protein
MKNSSMMNQETESRINGDRPLSLPCSPQAKRQRKRMHWILLIAGLLLLVNILVTVSGPGNPLYDVFHPAGSTAGTSAGGH